MAHVEQQHHHEADEARGGRPVVACVAGERSMTVLGDAAQQQAACEADEARGGRPVVACVAGERK